MKKYPVYKDSGIEWLGDIPEHWNVKRLKFLVQNIVDRTKLNGFNIALENIESGTGRYIVSESSNEFSGDMKSFKNGDVLFNKLRPYLAKVYLTKQDGNCVGELLVLRPEQNIGSRFIFYRLLSRDFIEIVNGSTYGAKMPRASWEDFIRNLLTPYPDIAEQTAIANFLDHKTQQIDDLIAKKLQLIDLLKEERTAVINQAVTKGIEPDVPMTYSGIEWLGEIPEHWQIIKLKRCVNKIGSGITPKGGSTVYQDEGIALIRSQNVRFEGLDLNDVAFISDEINASMKNSEVIYGDVLLNITGASIGRCCLYSEPYIANVNQHVCIVRPNKKNNSLFLNYILQSSYGQNLIRYYITGSGREGLNFENISNFEIPLPNLQEQNEIVNHINAKKQQIEKQIKISEQQIRFLKEYKTCLINETVTGKIKVSNGN